MPRILSTTGSHLDFLIPTGGRNSHVLTNLITALVAPADLQGIDSVARNALSCAQAFTGVSDTNSPGIWEFIQALSGVVQVFAQQDMAKQPMAAAGRATRFPQWALFLGVSDCWSETEKAGIGAELARALLLQQPFSGATAREFLRRNRTYQSEITSEKFALQLIRKASEVMDAAISTSSRELRTNSLILACISSQLNPLRIKQRQTAGSTGELTEYELDLAGKQLKENALSGCLVSLQIICAYCIGLVWDVALEVPFLAFVKGEWVAHIDVATGLTKVDLTPCFTNMAQSQPGHVPSSPVLVRPLPQFAAELLRGIVAKNPHAMCLRQLNNTDIHSTSLIPGVSNDLHRLTIAKVVATRGTHAMRCGLDRATATYVTADFTKNGKSKNYYTTFSPAEIWVGSTLVYNRLNWGQPVSMETGHMLHMGSRATPTEETIKSIDQTLQANVFNNKAGKKYTLASINAHTNAFSLLCAHRTALYSLGRAATDYGFFADEVTMGRPFDILADKNVGPHGGRTPIPVPSCKSTQIQFWLAHLEIYDARLSKLGVPASSPVRTRIRGILSGEKVRLFFLVTERGEVKDVGSADISNALPEGLRIKFDFGRHYFQNKLREPKVPQNWIDAAARHHVDATSVSYVTANVRQIQWLSEVATHIDNISISLGLYPVVGLGKGRHK